MILTNRLIVTTIALGQNVNIIVKIQIGCRDEYEGY